LSRDDVLWLMAQLPGEDPDRGGRYREHHE